MDKGKTSIVIIASIAALFILFVALYFNAASQKKQVVSVENEVKFAAEKLSSQDLMIYWIGEFPEEMSGISSVVTVVDPADISEETLPVKSSDFKITVYDENGGFVKSVEPRDYAEQMLIVITGVGMLTDPQKDILMNCMTQNGVPVLAIGSSSISLVRDMLYYTPGSFTDNDSFYFCFGSGYKDHVLDSGKIASGGREYALEVMNFVLNEYYQYEPEEETTTTESISESTTGSIDASSEDTTETSALTTKWGVLETTEDIFATTTTEMDFAPTI